MHFSNVNSRLSLGGGRELRVPLLREEDKFLEDNVELRRWIWRERDAEVLEYGE